MKKKETKKPPAAISSGSPPSDENMLILIDESRKSYEEDHSPLPLIWAFRMAYRYGFPIPQWVVENLYDKFQEYMEAKGEKSLDVIFGFKGKSGPGTGAFSKAENKKRDLFLMSLMYGWKSFYKLSFADAAEVTCVQMKKCFPTIPEWYITSPEQLAKQAYGRKWKKEFENGNPLGRMVLNLDDVNFALIIDALKDLVRPDIVNKLESSRATLSSAIPEKSRYSHLTP